MGRTKASALADLEISLGNLKTDYVDLFQLHNITELPDINDPESSYYALIEAKNSGKCRFIGITTHRLEIALEAAKCGLYDTVQFPLCYMSAERDLEIIRVCKENNIGLIAMKGMSGGIISSPEAAFAFFTQYDNVVPIWGVQKKSELDDFLGYAEKGVVLDSRLEKIISEDRERFKDDFCRGCGY
jgi:aryl-alcohol dehydrogenase-like predicted oxidoreductase